MKVKAIDGILVMDATHPLTLKILVGDCKGGDPKHPDTCAAARAIRREHKVADVRVHLGRVYIRQNKGNWQRYMTPKSLRSEIIAFDRGGKFEPGEYTLMRPHPSHKATGKRYGGKKSQYRKTGKKRHPRHVVTDVRLG